MVRKKELARAYEELQSSNLRTHAEAARLRAEVRALKAVRDDFQQSVAAYKVEMERLKSWRQEMEQALLRAGVAYEPYAFVSLPWQAEYNTPKDVEAAIGRIRGQRDMYRNAFILLAHTEARRSAADPKEVARAQKAHRKAGDPRIAYDDTTGMTRLLYPAPPTKPPLEP